MVNTPSRIKNPETLARLGKQLRQQRERAGVAQSRVRGMRQATVSKIETGGDVTLDTFIAYATSLGLEVALAPIGQAIGQAGARGGTGAVGPANLPPPAGKPVDLLTEFADLRDDEA